MSLDAVERLADAVLYEGYVLYPYRASAAKNRMRWQWGVAAPRAFSAATGLDRWFLEADCLLETDSPAAALVDVRLRWLQVQQRDVQIRSASGLWRPAASLHAGDREILPWQEGVARQIDVRDLDLSGLLDAEVRAPVVLPDGSDIEPVGPAGRIVRLRHALEATLRISAAPAPVTGGTKRPGLLRLHVRLENTTAWQPAGEPRRERDLAMPRALVGAHAILAARGATFVSLIDPGAGAAEAAAACDRAGWWPVVAGDPTRRDLLLLSPIILYDYSEVAPESPMPFFDGTEIDELLSLRVLTLTEDEKREARATDARARAVIDRTEAMPPDVFERLHGVSRSVSEGGGVPLRPAAAPPEPTPGWRALLDPPGAPSPGDDGIDVHGVWVTKGSRVVVTPKRRADAIDMFVRDRVALVQGVFHDVDGSTYVGLVLEDDPSADLQIELRRFLYYGPDEIEPLPAREERPV